MKSRKEKENKEQKKKRKLSDIWYINWYPFLPKWKKVQKWTAYILGAFLVLSSIILFVKSIIEQGFTLEMLAASIVLILCGALFIFVLANDHGRVDILIDNPLFLIEEQEDETKERKNK